MGNPAVALSKKSVGFFFEILMEQSPIFKFVLRNDGGLSKAHIARHSESTSLVHVIMSMVANHAPSVPILSQFPSSSMSINLAFQLFGKTLKSSYVRISY